MKRAVSTRQTLRMRASSGAVLLLAVLAGTACGPDLELVGFGQTRGRIVAGETGPEVIECPAPTATHEFELYMTKADINLEDLADLGQFGEVDRPPGRFELYAEVHGTDEDATVTMATIRFPSGVNSFSAAIELESTRYFTHPVPAHGTGTFAIPIIEPSEIAIWRAAHAASLAQEGMAAAEEAVVPFIAEVTVFGEDLDGGELESNALRIPLHVCANCQTRSTGTCHIDSIE